MTMTRARPYAIVITFTFVALVGLWLQTTPATRPGPGSAGSQQARVSTSPARRDGVFAMRASPAKPSVPTNAVRPATSGSVDPAPAPFAFLGRFTEHGETVVLLYGAGSTLKVRGTGPVADGYEVDALLDDLLVLRHVPSGTQQLIELTARESLPLSSLLEDFPRD